MRLRAPRLSPWLRRTRPLWISLLVGLGIIWAVQSSRAPLSHSESDAASIAALESDEALLTTVADTVRRGDTFSGLLLRNQISVQDIGQILEANRRRQFFSPRTLQPGQAMSLTRDEYSRFRRLRFEVSPEEIYVFEMQQDSLLAYQEPVSREIRLRKFEGDIQSTFEEALCLHGGDYRLVLKVADLLAFDLDFCTEVQKGDHYNFLVEERFANGQFLGYGDVLLACYRGKEANSEAVFFRAQGSREGGHYDLKGQALRKAFLRSPLNYRRVSSAFASRRFHPILKRWRPHHGVDYSAPSGTPVVAIAEGTVQTAGWKGGYGRCVQIRHQGKTETLYGHLSRFGKGLERGARVRQGQVIGYVGMSGLATGPHLHFELHQDGRRIDPLRVKNIPAEPIPATETARFHEWRRQLEDLNRALASGQVLDPFDPNQLPTALASLAFPSPGILLEPASLR